MSTAITGFTKTTFQGKLPEDCSSFAPMLNGELREEFETALSGMAVEFKRNLEIVGTSHYPQFFKEDDPIIALRKPKTIFIHPFSLPDGSTPEFKELSEELVVTKKKYKLRGLQRDAMVYSGPKIVGFLMLSGDKVGDSKGDVLTLFHAHHIYFVADFFDMSGGEWETLTPEDKIATARESFEMILDILEISIKCMQEKFKLDDFEALESQRIEKIKNSWVANYPKLVELKNKGLKDTYLAERDRLVTMEEEYRVACDNYQNAKRNYDDAVLNSGSIAAVSNDRMFAGLMNSFYESIDIDTSAKCIVALTKMIFIRESGRIYAIGQIKIRIPLETSASIVAENIAPMTISGERIHHPHINGSGGICLGNTHSVVSDLRKKGSILELLELLGSFMFSYNVKSVFTKITVFKDVTEQFSEEEIAYDNDQNREEKSAANAEQLINVLRRAAAPAPVTAIPPVETGGV